MFDNEWLGAKLEVEERDNASAASCLPRAQPALRPLCVSLPLRPVGGEEDGSLVGVRRLEPAHGGRRTCCASVRTLVYTYAECRPRCVQETAATNKKNATNKRTV